MKRFIHSGMFFGIFLVVCLTAVFPFREAFAKIDWMQDDGFSPALEKQGNVEKYDLDIDMDITWVKKETETGAQYVSVNRVVDLKFRETAVFTTRLYLVPSYDGGKWVRNVVVAGRIFDSHAAGHSFIDNSVINQIRRQAGHTKLKFEPENSCLESTKNPKQKTFDLSFYLGSNQMSATYTVTPFGAPSTDPVNTTLAYPFVVRDIPLAELKKGPYIMKINETLKKQISAPPAAGSYLNTEERIMGDVKCTLHRR
ncbi:MAG: hypothetical protein WC133_04760 [Candidatus Omnitrophota bacterium]